MEEWVPREGGRSRCGSSRTSEFTMSPPSRPLRPQSPLPSSPSYFQLSVPDDPPVLTSSLPRTGWRTEGKEAGDSKGVRTFLYRPGPPDPSPGPVLSVCTLRKTRTPESSVTTTVGPGSRTEEEFRPGSGTKSSSPRRPLSVEESWQVLR